MNYTVDFFTQKSQEIRCTILDMVYKAQSGHIGGSFSATELLVVLFYQFLKLDPKNSQWSERDYFVLSKGHASPVYYALLSDLGFFDKSVLDSFRQVNSILQGHPDHKLVPGVECSTGSLGQGLGNALGMALATKVSQNPAKVVVMAGDGEIQEGVAWEVFMAAGYHKLSHFLVIIDYNHYQIDGNLKDIMDIDPLEDKLKAFNFETIFLTDGHCIEDIQKAYDYFSSTIDSRTKPLAIIAHTKKGKGVSFMEDTHAWHGKAPNKEQYDQALKELQG